MNNTTSDDDYDAYTDVNAAENLWDDLDDGPSIARDTLVGLSSGFARGCFELSNLLSCEFTPTEWPMDPFKEMTYFFFNKLDEFALVILVAFFVGCSFTIIFSNIIFLAFERGRKLASPRPIELVAMGAHHLENGHPEPGQSQTQPDQNQIEPVQGQTDPLQPQLDQDQLGPVQGQTVPLQPQPDQDQLGPVQGQTDPLQPQSDQDQIGSVQGQTDPLQIQPDQDQIGSVQGQKDPRQLPPEPEEIQSIAEDGDCRQLNYCIAEIHPEPSTLN